MDYSGWPPQQNPNPSVDPNQIHWQAVDYSANGYYNSNADPHQFPGIYPPNAWFQPQPQPQPQPPGVDQPYVPQPQPQPQPQPPGVDQPYVPPPTAVTYAEQAVSYAPQQSAAVATAAPAAVYYPDPNAGWATSFSQIGYTPNAVGVSMPNPAAQPQITMPNPAARPQINMPTPAAQPQIAMPNPVAQPQIPIPNPATRPQIAIPNPVTQPQLVVPNPATQPQLVVPNPATQPKKRNTKKKTHKKTKVAVQPSWCEVCRVDCNSKDVLEQHKLGKKHRKNLEKLKFATVLNPSIVAAPSAAAVAALATSQAIVPSTPAATVTSQAIATAPAAAPAITDTPPAAVATSPAVEATVPAIEAAVPTDLPVPASAMTDKPVIGPEENPDRAKLASSKKSRKKAAARTDNLETKRRKVLEGGASAGSVRSCSICNVVCNSDTVFNYHIAGQKHALMVKKQAARAGVSSAT